MTTPALGGLRKAEFLEKTAYCTKGMPKATRLEELFGSRYGLLYTVTLAILQVCWRFTFSCNHAHGEQGISGRRGNVLSEPNRSIAKAVTEAIVVESCSVEDTAVIPDGCH